MPTGDIAFFRELHGDMPEGCQGVLASLEAVEPELWERAAAILEESDGFSSAQLLWEIIEAHGLAVASPLRSKIVKAARINAGDLAYLSPWHKRLDGSAALASRLDKVPFSRKAGMDSAEVRRFVAALAAELRQRTGRPHEGFVAWAAGIVYPGAAPNLDIGELVKSARRTADGRRRGPFGPKIGRK
jgi:hypothetical protein